MKLIINFKTYRQGTGKKAVELSHQIDNYVQSQSLPYLDIGLAPQAVDLKQIAKTCKHLEIWAQAIDPIRYGSHTGSLLPEAVVNWVQGTLINHSEKRLPFEQIELAIKRCQALDMKSLVCVQNPEEAGKAAQLKPDLIAYEPPELIGGDISVAEAQPSLVKDAVNEVKTIAGPETISVLTGAGIKDKKDVEKALGLGTEGILIASGIVKAENPLKALKNLVQGFN